jgi:hypothetical protein
MEGMYGASFASRAKERARILLLENKGYLTPRDEFTIISVIEAISEELKRIGVIEEDEVERETESD